MKAFRIISHESEYNKPSVFLFADGKYYGCMNYPRSYNYPQDVDFWKNAMSSDVGRGFDVEEVEVNPHILYRLESIQVKMHSSRLELETIILELV